jgi:hypothetical protein
MQLLTKGISSPKLAKYAGTDYMSAILYLASAVYEPSLCPNAGDCKNSCLITQAGRGAFDPVVSAARNRRSDWLLSDRPGFESQLVREIAQLVAYAAKRGKRVAIRLNGGSDLDWSSVYSQFPGVVFWEYTKRPELALRLQSAGVHVTYSVNERTTPRILQAISMHRISTATVYSVARGKPLPAGIVDGDLHDFRFLDARGSRIGLRLKSNKRVTASKLTGGFVRAV